MIDKLSLFTSRKNKKRKMIFTVLIVAELIITLSYLYNTLQIGNIHPLLTRPNLFVGLLIIQSLLVAWVMEFDLRPLEAILFLIPSNLYVAASVVVLMGVRSVLIAGILFTILVIGYYILIAATNIVNVSTIRPVPLKKAALSSLFFIGMVISFLLGWRLMYLGEGISVLIWIWTTVSLFGVSFLYMAAEDRRIHSIEMLVFAWVVFQIVMILNFWPLSATVAAVISVGWSFVVLGVLYHQINKNLTPAIIREYLLFSLLLLGVFFGFG